nr:hypothetical protein [Tanacetum cinerariifolium]
MHLSSLRDKAVSATESSTPPSSVAAGVCEASLDCGGLVEVAGPTFSVLGGGEGGLGESWIGSHTRQGVGTLIGVCSLTGVGSFTGVGSLTGEGSLTGKDRGAEKGPGIEEEEC